MIHGWLNWLIFANGLINHSFQISVELISNYCSCLESFWSGFRSTLTIQYLKDMYKLTVSNWIVCIARQIVWVCSFLTTSYTDYLFRSEFEFHLQRVSGKFCVTCLQVGVNFVPVNLICLSSVKRSVKCCCFNVTLPFQWNTH